MKFKKYLVTNMNEAITLIKKELGDEAIIVSHRQVKRKGFFGQFRPKMLEVTATIEETPKINHNVRNTDPNEDFAKNLEAIKSLFNKENESYKKKAEIDTDEKISYNEIIKEVREVKSMMSKIKSNGIGNNTSKITEYLLERDFIEEYALELEEMVSHKDNLDDKLDSLREIMEEEITVNQDIRASIMIFVGPTGVGKTTTIAKLAGKYALKDKKKVGLMTIDTYRIGAVDQLRTYADIMNLPFEVVFTTREMEDSLKKMRNCDIILIDTTGRSSKNIMQLSELRLFIDKAENPSINLVISSTTKNRDLKSIIDGYKELRYSNVIITKLDETNTYGSIYNISKLSQKPISYITNGQSVPDNIEVANKKKIASLILQED